MAGSPLLEIDSLTFRYRRATEPAIRDLSLQMEPGEVLLVAGPSGCGKSTLIRAINGLIPHSYRGEMSGRVTVAGRSTVDLRLRDLARLVGTVLQDPRRQLVASTVEAELVFGPENLGIGLGEIDRLLSRVVDQAEIAHLLGRTTDELSGGEAQQIAVAGALILEPRILVLDEPLANLDPHAAQRLLALTRTVADAGAAVIVVEHRVEDALALRPERILYLDAGRAVYLGGTDGFLRIADPDAVKLPFASVLQAVRRHPKRWSTTSAAPSGSSVAGPPRLEWRQVEAGYEAKAVLHDVSAALGGAQTIAVLGPNGSGKTTLFKVAIGLIPLMGGEVLVDGRSIAGRPVVDLVETFGYVFQNPSQMLFAPTVREELLFGPTNLGRDRAAFDMLVDVSLARVGLSSDAEIDGRPPLTLSFGQQKRLGIAVALALQPRTLVLDEPSAGQDHRSATAFMEEIARIEGLESVYFVTHDVDLALTHASRILLMREGRIVADGSPLEVIADRDRWTSCNLRVTSLMDANARFAGQADRYLSAVQLASQIVRESQPEGIAGRRGTAAH